MQAFPLPSFMKHEKAWEEDYIRRFVRSVRISEILFTLTSLNPYPTCALTTPNLCHVFQLVWIISIVTNKELHQFLYIRKCVQFTTEVIGSLFVWTKSHLLYIWYHNWFHFLSSYILWLRSWSSKLNVLARVDESRCYISSLDWISGLSLLPNSLANAD